MEHQGFLHPHDDIVVLDGPVISGGLPVPLVGSPIHPCPISILPIQCTEKVVLLVPALQARLVSEVPGLTLVDVDLGDRVKFEGFATDLALEVVNDEFLVCWVEPEAGSEGSRGRWQCRRH